jgi:hypothetical protein
MVDSYLSRLLAPSDDNGMEVANAAPRFTLALPMRYRRVGQLQWQTAKTVNVSSSGLLFLTVERFAPGTRLEVEISMTASMLKPSHLSSVSEVLRQKEHEALMLTTVHHVSSQTVEGDFA